MGKETASPGSQNGYSAICSFTPAPPPGTTILNAPRTKSATDAAKNPLTTGNGTNRTKYHSFKRPIA